MNTTTARQISALNEKTSTDVIRGAVLALMTKKNITAAERRALKISIGELMQRDFEFAAFIQAAM